MHEIYFDRIPGSNRAGNSIHRFYIVQLLLVCTEPLIPENKNLSVIFIYVFFVDSMMHTVVGGRYKEELNKTKLMQIYSKLMDDGLPPENLISITEGELTRRVRQLMAMELLGTLLDGLSPEEIQIFNEAVKGR